MIPEHLQKLYDQERWDELYYYFRKKSEEKNWLYLKKYRNAVDRVKAAFVEIFGGPAYGPGTSTHFFDEKIAFFCDRLGVAALIDDFKLAKAKYGNIKSIVYFLHSGKGASRWEMLHVAKLERDWEQFKAKEKKETEEFAKKITINRAAAQEPDWVIAARKRYNQLQQQAASLTLTSDQLYQLQREMSKIVNNFKKFNYQLSPQRP